MATHHIHVHLHHGMFNSETTADAGNFEENKHKREGGKFSSTGGGGAAPAPATGRSAFAAKHNPAAKAAAAKKPETEQEKLDRAREENPIL